MSQLRENQNEAIKSNIHIHIGTMENGFCFEESNILWVWPFGQSSKTKTKNGEFENLEEAMEKEEELDCDDNGVGHPLSK